MNLTYKLYESDKQVIINKEKRTCHFVDLVVSVDHRMKMKENERKKPPKTRTSPVNWDSLGGLLLIVDAFGTIHKIEDWMNSEFEEEMILPH